MDALEKGGTVIHVAEGTVKENGGAMMCYGVLQEDISHLCRFGMEMCAGGRGVGLQVASEFGQFIRNFCVVRWPRLW